jgi:hypothetical protein
MPKPIIVSKPFNVTAGQIVDPTGELAKYGVQGADIPSAPTIDLASATGDYVRVTGNIDISSLGIAPAGVVRTVEFTGSLKLKYNSQSMILPAGTDLQTQPHDMAMFRSRGSGAWICASFQSASGAPPIQLTPDDIGLGNVENVALSTWPGSSNITTVGTITSGVWQGSPIAVNKGGTGQTAIAQGDLLYGFTQNEIRRLAKNTQATRYITNQGPLSDNSPVWGQVDLTNGVTGVLPGANGGRGAIVQTLAAVTGITIAIDMALGNMVLMNLASATGNVTLTLTNGTPGLLNFLVVTQGATARNLIFPTGAKQTLLGGITWTPSGVNKIDIITFVYDGSIYHILGTAPDMG